MLSGWWKPVDLCIGCFWKSRIAWCSCVVEDARFLMRGLLSISCFMRDGKGCNFLSMVVLVMFFTSMSRSAITWVYAVSLVSDLRRSSSTARSAVCRLRISILVVVSSWMLFILVLIASIVLGKVWWLFEHHRDHSWGSKWLVGHRSDQS